MNTKNTNNLTPTHKILLVSKTHIESLDHLFSSLEKEGIASSVITTNDLGKPIDSFKSNFLFIHTMKCDDDLFVTAMNRIPELSGVLFCFGASMSRLDILRSVAIARRHYVAIIGAIFLIESEDDDKFGVDMCRRSGIPYLFSAIKKKDNGYHVNQKTIAALVEMAR